jgi:3-mercaptopyruvate sulfurtransferase SseA
VPIDCSCDSIDGKTKAAEVYKYQRIDNALYLNMNQFFKKPKHLTPSAAEFKAAA